MNDEANPMDEEANPKDKEANPKDAESILMDEEVNAIDKEVDFKDKCKEMLEAVCVTNAIKDNFESDQVHVKKTIIYKFDEGKTSHIVPSTSPFPSSKDMQK